MKNTLRRRLDRYISSEHTKTIVLTLTNSCNLNCVYCYEGNKDGRTMSFSTAKDIIIREMESSSAFDMICIDFMGGEPFLEFSLMKEIFSFLKAGNWPKKWFCFATTNGTLVHGDIQRWLLDNRDFMEALLSLDGTRRMQNINRSDSYDSIDIDFFRRTCPYVKMTVSNQTLPYLSDGIIDMHERGLHVSANLGYGIDWDNSENLNIFANQLKILCDYYLLHPDIEPSTILDLGIEVINPFVAETTIKYCGVGTQMTAYDVDGIDYPCHTLAPLTLGDKKASEARKLEIKNIIEKCLLDKKCAECPVLSICPTCYGINFEQTGNIYHKDDGYCKMLKVQFLANAYFKYQNYLLGNYRDISPEEEYRLLNNIKLVQTLRW